MITTTTSSAKSVLDRKNLIKQIAERHEANNRVAKSISESQLAESEYDAIIAEEHQSIVGPQITTTIPHDPDFEISDGIV